jgi:hypothetical protein
MDTQEAVIPVAHKIVMPRSRLIFTPEDLASSSDRGRRFILQRSRNRIAIPRRIIGAPSMSVL